MLNIRQAIDFFEINALMHRKVVCLSTTTIYY
jgi:hypothetical protein